MKAAEFRGLCKSKIKVQIDGTTVTPSDYRGVGNIGYWLLFVKVNGVTIVDGNIDANGTGF